MLSDDLLASVYIMFTFSDASNNNKVSLFGKIHAKKLRWGSKG